MATEVRFTIHDLELFTEEGIRREVIDGEIHVSTQPHWRHQLASGFFFDRLLHWSVDAGGAGLPIAAPGIIFSEEDAVAPDLVWISRERIGRVIGDDGKLHAAPDLIVEILSAGAKNEERDRELKLKLYSRRGVREYWIGDWRDESLQIFRRQNQALQLVATLTSDDVLTSPLLPGFSVRVGAFFAAGLPEK